MSLFFPRMQKNMDKIASNSTPPPPLLCLSPSNVGFQSLRAKTLCVCLLCYWWRGGGGGVREGRGGWTFKNVFEAFCLWKKMQGHFFTEKESACQISADSEQLGKSLWNSHIGPACTEPFIYSLVPSQPNTAHCPGQDYIVTMHSPIN